MVFQNYALYAHMNVADNMSFSLKLAKRPQSEIDEKVGWAAKILNLEPYLKRYPRELSGGQRQRVAMGRAIVRDPAVFLFDEPLSNLDAKLRVQMRTEIKDLHERLKTTTVYVTHDQIEAMTMADKIVILRDGRIEQVGSPLEVYDHPANLFVAAFIGSPAMNLLKGETVAAKDGVAVQSGDALLPLPKSRKVEVGRKVIYGVRPEHLDPVPDGEGLPAKVSVIEPTGPEIHIYAELAGEEICAITDERLVLKRDEIIGLKPRLDRVHLFDAESGQAIL
jgi:multiple sugar transport system ATP-binding protein